jgi:hypothetical protein
VYIYISLNSSIIKNSSKKVVGKIRQACDVHLLVSENRAAYGITCKKYGAARQSTDDIIRRREDEILTSNN